MKITFLIIFALLLTGLILYFYRRQEKKVATDNSYTEFSYETYINEKLLKLLTTQYPDFEFQLHGDAIISKTGLSLKTKIEDHGKYAQGESFQINFLTAYNNFFEKSIEERLAGIGENDTSALQNGLESFLSGQFPVIVDGINLKHTPEIDFDIIGDNGKTHWHPIIGNIQLQGELSKTTDSSIYDKTYKFIKPLIIEKLKNSSQDFHWFRYYISKMQNGEIIGDCYFDNDKCDEGMELLKKYASTWTLADKFGGQKQFILLRKCRE